MGKDKNRRRRGILGGMTDQVLGPKENGHKKVIENLVNSLDSENGQSEDTNVVALVPQNTRSRKVNDAVQTQAGESTRARNIKYTYRDKDGQQVEKFSADCRSVIFTMAEGGKQLEFGLLEIVKDEEKLEWLAEHAPMVITSSLFGLKTTVGNAVTAIKSGDWDEMFTALEERKETIVGGEWREGGTRGPSQKDVLEAMCMWYESKTGKEPSEAKRQQFLDKIKGEGTKAILTDAEVAAEHAAVKLRRQEENVRKAKAQAAQSQGSQLASLLD